MFRFGDDTAAAVWELYKREFECSADLLKLARELGNCIGSSRVPQIEDKAKYALQALLRRAVRQYEVVLLVCERSFFETAHILTRTLLEQLLTTHFVLKDPQPPRYQSADFRATLYAYFPIMQLERILDKASDTHMLANAARIRSQASEIRREIGNEWADRLKRSNHCSGLRIRELAIIYEHRADYDQVYSLQSLNVHAADALGFVRPNEQGTLTLAVPTAEVGRPALNWATGLFVVLIKTLNEALELRFKAQLGELESKVASLGK